MAVEKGLIRKHPENLSPPVEPEMIFKAFAPLKTKATNVHHICCGEGRTETSLTSDGIQDCG